MRFLLDTNILSELRKGPRTDGNVQKWFDGVEEDDLCTSVLVLGEIRRGIESLRRRDETAALALDQWLSRLVDTFADRILLVDASVADRWGILNVPDPVSTVDGLMAATAIVHDLTLVTRNICDIARTGARWYDPFVA